MSRSGTQPASPRAAPSSVSRAPAPAPAPALALAALLLILVVLKGLEEYSTVEQPECQCDTNECFMSHKENALRGAVGRARRKCETGLTSASRLRQQQLPPCATD